MFIDNENYRKTSLSSIAYAVVERNYHMQCCSQSFFEHIDIFTKTETQWKYWRVHCKTDSLTKVMTLFSCQTMVSHTDSVVWKYISGWQWYRSTNDTQLKKLLHGEAVVPPNSKIISSIIKESRYLDQELLSKWNNKFHTSDEFDNVLKMFKC